MNINGLCVKLLSSALLGFVWPSISNIFVWIGRGDHQTVKLRELIFVKFGPEELRRREPLQI